MVVTSHTQGHARDMQYAGKLMRISIPILMLCLIFTPLAHAGASGYKALKKEDYEGLLPGATIKGEYRYLRERTQTFNFEEDHFADGTTKYREGSLRANGIWYTVGKRKICYTYPGSEILSGVHCFWVFTQDGCYYIYNFTNMTLDQTPRRYQDWVARWIIKGDSGSCDAPVS